MAALAAASKSPDVVYSSDDTNKDLDAKLAEAQARLEKAARDVAELFGPDRGAFDGTSSWCSTLKVHHGQSSESSWILTAAKEARASSGSQSGGPADEAGLRVGDVITAINAPTSRESARRGM